MRLLVSGLIAGLFALSSCSEAFAFGRGAPREDAAIPPRGGGGHAIGGGYPAVAAGPFGGVHGGYVPPRMSGYSPAPIAPRTGSLGPFGGTAIIPPWGGVHPGGVIGGTGTVVPRAGVHGGVVIGPNLTTPIRPGHYTNYVGPSALHAIGLGIRGGSYPYFTRDWYRTHFGLWLPPVWFGGVGLWFVPPWPTLSLFVGIPGPPIVYEYGSTAVIQDGTVYVNGDPVAAAPDYAAQAIALDDVGRDAKLADSDEWQPLGVFGLIQPNEGVAQRIFQLAINRAGIVRGNYYDTVSDITLPVYGALDKKTQRVAWSIGDKKDIVFETTLNSLLQQETTVLIHYGKERTQQMILVHLAEPPAK